MSNIILERINGVALEEEKKECREVIRDMAKEKMKQMEQGRESLSAVARQASEQLGFNVLKEHLRNKRETSLKHLKHLKMMDVLGAVNALPFKNETVESYKKVKIAKEAEKQEESVWEGLGRVFLGITPNESHFRWERESLGDYSKPVPIAILQTALQIKKRLPGVKFYIEELSHDPFLIAYYGNRDYYIAVWDEPGFEARPAA